MSLTEGYDTEWLIAAIVEYADDVAGFVEVVIPNVVHHCIGLLIEEFLCRLLAIVVHFASAMTDAYEANNLACVFFGIVFKCCHCYIFIDDFVEIVRRYDGEFGS